MTDCERNIKGLQNISPLEFEELVADLWERQGWDTTVTAGSRDRGIDIIAERTTPVQERHLIQTKRYQEENKLGSDDVRKYATLRQQEDNVDSIIIVSTGQVTDEAKQLANDLNIKIINGQRLLAIIRNEDSEDLLEDYISINPKEAVDDGSRAIKNQVPRSVEVTHEVEVESNLLTTLKLHKRLTKRMSEPGGIPISFQFHRTNGQMAESDYQFDAGMHTITCRTDHERTALGDVIGSSPLEVITSDRSQDTAVVSVSQNPSIQKEFDIDEEIRIIQTILTQVFEIKPQQISYVNFYKDERDEAAWEKKESPDSETSPISLDETCSDCNGELQWNPHSNLAECNSCDQRFKMRNGDWVSTEDAPHPKQQPTTDKGPSTSDARSRIRSLLARLFQGEK